MRLAWLGLLWLGWGGLAAEVPVAQPQPLGDGRLAYRHLLVLEAPPEHSLAYDRAAVLVYNRAGRVVQATAVSQTELAEWTGGRLRLAPAQRLLFSRHQILPVADAAVRVDYIFYGALNTGERLRQVKTIGLGGAVEPAPTGGGPRFEVHVVPDPLEAVVAGRTGRRVWGGLIWLQETNGVGVSVKSIEWLARSLDGRPIAQGVLDETALREAAGGNLCGPDGVLALPLPALEPTDAERGELLLVARGQREGGGEVSAIGRFELLPAAPRVGRTILRLPFRGTWRLALGPGQPPHVGAAAYSYLFDRLDRAGRPFIEPGTQVKQHAAWGQPVLAPAAGVVSEIGDYHRDAETPRAGGRFAGAGGDNFVLLDHGDGETSYLGGLRLRSLKVIVGQRVEAGQEVGLVGSLANGLGRPALLYRLLRRGETELTLQPRFVGWELVGAPTPPLPATPETGDQVTAR